MFQNLVSAVHGPVARVSTVLALIALAPIALLPIDTADAAKWGQCWKARRDFLNKENPLHKSKFLANQILDFSIQATTVLPAVTSVSGTSYVSSTGPCAMIASVRQEYIEQNLDEIKKQIAVGRGGHIDTLAVFSSCPFGSASRLGSLMQKNLSHVYDIPSSGAAGFGAYIDWLIESDHELSLRCAPVVRL
jgi:hypothetical protein